MNQGRITQYTGETAAHRRIATYISATWVPPVYPAWKNFVSMRSVRAIALAPRSQQVWLATWGGVISWSMKEEMIYRRYSSEHGLASNLITCICVDEKERPWTGHEEGGLSYFEHQRWHVYSHLQDRTIRVICPAVQRGGIWVASIEGVYHIPGPDFPPIPIAIGESVSMQVLTLLDTGSTLLVGNAGGLFCLQANKQPAPLATESIEACTALTCDRSGQIWIGTPRGIYRLEGEDIIGPIVPEDREASAEVQVLTASRDRLWVLTPDGLAQIVGGHWIPVQGPPEAQSVLHTIAALSSESNLWVGTDRLLARVQSQGQAEPIWNLDWLPLQQEEELNNLGRCIAQESFNGSVWIGTAGGLLEVTQEDQWILHKEMDDVRALNLTSGTTDTLPQAPLWILSWPQGIGSWSVSGRFDVHGMQSLKLPVALATGQDGYLYALAGNALWQITSNDARAIAKPLPLTARCLAQTPDRYWWVGTTQGIYRLVAGRWELVGEQPGPRQSGVRALAVIWDHLWAATEVGLWQLQGEQWQPYRIAPDDPLCDIRALTAAGQDGALWLARREGIVRYHPAIGEQSRRYTPKDSGLGSCRVTALAEINSMLWIATQAGISCLKLDEE